MYVVVQSLTKRLGWMTSDLISKSVLTLQASQVRKSSYTPDEGVQYNPDAYHACTVYAGTVVNQVSTILDNPGSQTESLHQLVDCSLIHAGMFMCNILHHVPELKAGVLCSSCCFECKQSKCTCNESLPQCSSR